MPALIKKPAPELEARVSQLGRLLAGRLRRVIAAVPGASVGPVRLAASMGVDKVLASRVLRASTHRDPIAALKMMPGPDPLRRLNSAAAERGVASELIADLNDAVGQFEDLIRTEAGDRSGLDAILSAWLPESRGEFELRRKQAAYRAMSQLKGASADISLATVFIAPNKNDPEQLDLVWVLGLLGLQRLRPGAAVKFASRRVHVANVDSHLVEDHRHPRSLGGTPVEDLAHLRLPRFCSSPPPELIVQRAGESVHYVLAGDRFGPASAIDLVIGEVNIRELPRRVEYRDPPPKRFVSAEITTPAKRLIFDAFAHRDLQSPPPKLSTYDTSFEGVASANDPSRDIDKLDLSETITPLGEGIARARSTDVPWYADLLETVCREMNWDGGAFQGWRTRIDYPIYGSQVVIAWDAPIKTG